MRISFASVLALCAVSSALAAGTATQPAVDSCKSHFVGGVAPRPSPAIQQTGLRALCSAGYAALHSGRTRGPLYSAEHLTRDRVVAARRLARTNSFRADHRLPPAERAELVDYARSGFDRGHIAPNGDMPDADTQAESFLLSNMVPQDPTSNRHLWSDIEAAARAMVVREGEAYVVTGPAYFGKGRWLNGRVAVPDYLWKAIYLPRTNQAAAWIAPNSGERRYEVISLSQLQSAVGIDVFPTLPTHVKERASAILRPYTRSR